MNRIHCTYPDETAVSREISLKKLRCDTRINRRETSFMGNSLEKSASFSLASREGEKLREQNYW